MIQERLQLKSKAIYQPLSNSIHHSHQEIQIKSSEIPIFH